MIAYDNTTKSFLGMACTSGRIILYSQENKMVKQVGGEQNRFLWALSWTALFSFLANGFSYFNFFPVHDAVGFTIGGSYKEWQIRLGRFLIPVYEYLKGHIAVPFLTGILSILYLGISVYLITAILKQKTRLEIVLTSAFLSANLFTVEINAVHQYFADVFLLALLLSCLGAFFICKYNNMFTNALSCLALYLSFGLYPAFITFAACLLVFAAILDIVKNNGVSRRLKRKILIGLLVLAVSGLLYLLTSRIVLYIMKLSPSDANWSIYTIGKHNTASFWKAVINNYRHFFSLFFDSESITGKWPGVATAILMLLCVCFFLTAYWEKTSKWVFLLMSFLMFLFPLGSRLVNIFTNANNAYRTMFAQFLMFPFMVKLLFLGLDYYKVRKSDVFYPVITALLLLASVILWYNVRYSNEAFTAQRIYYERANYHTGRVLQDLDSCYPERDRAEKIALVGLFQTEGPDDKFLKKFSAIGGMNRKTGITYQGVFFQEARNLGYSLVNAGTADYEAIPAVKNMPCYPTPGYIKKVDDVIVIKLAD